MLEVLDGHAARRWAAAALDALGDAARGDRRAQRVPGARRRHRHQPVPHRRGGRASRAATLPRRRRPRARSLDALRPRRPARRPRQLRRHPQPAAARLADRSRRATPDERTPPCWPTRMAAGRRAGVRRGRDAGRGHHPDASPGRPPTPPTRVPRAPSGRRSRRGRRRPPRPPARRCPHARAARGAARRPASSTPAAGGSCVILDARRDGRSTGRRRAHRPPARPAPARGPDLRRPRRPRRGRPGLRGDVPARAPTTTRSARCATARRPSATRWSWSAATGLWNVHVHVDDVGAAIEAGHRGRPPAPDPGHALRRAGRRGRRRPRRARRPRGRRRRRRARPGRAVRGGRRASCVERRPAGVPSTGELARGDRAAPAPPRSSCCPTTRDTVAAAEAAARTAARDDGIRVA